MILCAHSDDEAAGMGGTICKYVDLGKEIVKIIFSFGEMSHPHLQEKITKKTRFKETEEISKKFGIKKTLFLGLRDAKVKEEIEEKKVKEKLKNIIKEYQPRAIYIPSSTDIHKDHRAVHDVTIETLDELKYKCDVYAFEVWNIAEENMPHVYEDITNYFKKKIEMMKAFKSQKHFMYPLLIPAHFRARKYGRKSGCKYAEKFYKIR